jgi:virginiamycin B lyase
MRLTYLRFFCVALAPVLGAFGCGSDGSTPTGAGGGSSGGTGGSASGGTAGTAGTSGGAGGTGGEGGRSGAGGSAGAGAAGGTAGTSGKGGSAGAGATGGVGGASGAGGVGGTAGVGGTGGNAGSGQAGTPIDAGRAGSAGSDAGSSDAPRETSVPPDGAPPRVVTEITIPRSTGCTASTPFPHDPAVDETNGIVYYVDSDNSCVGRYDPATMQFTAWPTPTPNSYPHGLTVGPAGHVFYTGQRANLLGRLDPTAGQITNEYPAMTDPHTPLFHMGAVWFTAQTGNRYGRLDLTAGTIALWNVPTANARPYGMDDAPNGHLWIALFGTNKLGEVDPANPSMLIEHVLPNAASRPRRLAVDSEGRVWYGDYSRDRLGRFNPATKEFREWETTNTTGLPYGIVIGPDGRVWYNDDGASTMVAFDPVTEMSETVPIPTRGSTVRNVAVDMPRRRIWLALSGTGRLGVIQL